MACMRSTARSLTPPHPIRKAETQTHELSNFLTSYIESCMRVWAWWVGHRHTKIAETRAQGTSNLRSNHILDLSISAIQNSECMQFRWHVTKREGIRGQFNFDLLICVPIVLFRPLAHSNRIRRIHEVILRPLVEAGNRNCFRINSRSISLAKATSCCQVEAVCGLIRRN